MLEARFYVWSKKLNSTAQPPSDPHTYTSYDVVLKNNTNISEPGLILALGTSSFPIGTYVHIPAFNRYYFIQSWEYIDHGNWICYCYVDVLASYKTEIGLHNLYITRSAYEYDDDLIDSFYPASTKHSISITYNSDTPWSTQGDIDIANGVFIVGVESQNATFGSVDYFFLQYQDLADLCYYLTSDFVSTANLFDITDASIPLQRTLVNPLQFIKSAIWLPIAWNAIQSYGTYTDVLVWTYDTGVNGYKMGNKAVYETAEYSLATTEHPQALAHGSYMNCAPFTNVSICIPPFGMIELDPTLISKHQYVYVKFYVDLITGKVIAEISVGTSRHLLHRLSTQLGVPIQLSQMTRDYLGAVTNAGGAVKQLLTGNVLGALSGVGNALGSIVPKTQSIGSNGGYADLYGDFQLIYTFYDQTDINITEHGKPLMKTKQISTIPGYILCENADIDIAAPSNEVEAIRNYVTSGFFYE